MPYIHPDVLDQGLNLLDTATTRMDICQTQEPTTRTEAITTYSVGNKTSLSIGAPTNRTPSGRRVTVATFTDGTVTATATAGWWAITDGTRLLAAGALSSTQAVTNGNTWGISASFDIGIPAA